MIREADILDISAIRRVVEEVWPVAYREVITKEQISYMLDRMYNDESLLRQMTLEGCTFLVEVENDEVIGFASFSEVADHTFKLHKLYVYTNQQGKGVGKKLLDAVCESVKSAGGSSLELQVNKKNFPAQRFYEKNGFKVKEEAVFDIGNGFVMDDFILEKLID